MISNGFSEPLVQRVYHAAFSPDGARILRASWDKTAKLWDAASGKLAAPLTIRTGSTTRRLAQTGPHSTLACALVVPLLSQPSSEQVCELIAKVSPFALALD